jgi:phosphatidylserine decarboxylase
MFRLTRHGLREMLVGGLILAAIAIPLFLLYKPLALLPLPVLVWLLAFFRDPQRKLPDDPHVMLSPADGTISDILQIPHDPLLDAPAIRVGIFLSVFNAHINRSPCDGRVLAINYKKGKFLSALRHNEASGQNESNTLVLADPSTGRPVAVVRQITGAIARRIICDAAVGDRLARGQRIGMIKFGSRTELTIPAWLNPQLRVAVGQSVRAGSDIIAGISQPLGSGEPGRAAASHPDLSPAEARA